MSPGPSAAPGGTALHRFALGLACGVVLLIAAGALVKSKEAGLAVPDWPLSYGSLNPPRWWQIENVRAEHGHRLIAGAVALATVALAVLASRREPRRWVRRLAWTAVAAVLAQAVLGGITVLFFLPTAVSVGHAALAEIFLCLIVALAVVTSRRWRAAGAVDPGRAPASAGITSVSPVAATVATVLVYLQILIGAVMRHTGAGLAIPDFPLAFGRLVPPRFDFGIAIHYAHRLGALAVAVAVAVVLAAALRRARREPALAGAAGAMALLVVAQVALGAAVVLGGRAVPVNTAHVATGATLLAASFALTLMSWRLARPAREPRAVARAIGGLGEAAG